MNELENEITETLRYMANSREPSLKTRETILNHFQEATLKKKKHSFLKRLSYCTAAVIIMFGLLITSAVFSPNIAEAISNVPFFESLFALIGDQGLKVADNGGFTRTCNQVAEDSGIRLTINDVLYDDARISIGFIEECDGGYKDFINDQSDILINNKLAPRSSIRVSHRDAGENTYIGILNIELDVDDPDLQNNLKNSEDFFFGELPDEFILGLKIRAIDDIHGNWDFNIPVSKKASQAVTKVFPTNVSKKYNGDTLTVSQVKFTPSCVELSVTCEPFGETQICTYRVFDDQGKELEPIQNSGSEPIYLPVKHMPKYLKLIPYTASSITVRQELFKQYPITLSQGNLGEVTIRDIEFLPDKTLIYFDFSGKGPTKEPGLIKIEGEEKVDENTVNRILLGFAEGKKKLKKVKKVGENSYIQEYKAIDSSRKLYLTTTAEIDAQPIKELSSIIPLR